MPARYSDLVIGRFYSKDPVGFTGIHTFNRYDYANNNPYKYTEPDGRQVEILFVSGKYYENHMQMLSNSVSDMFAWGDTKVQASQAAAEEGKRGRPQGWRKPS